MVGSTVASGGTGVPREVPERREEEGVGRRRTDGDALEDAPEFAAEADGVGAALEAGGVAKLRVAELRRRREDVPERRRQADDGDVRHRSVLVAARRVQREEGEPPIVDRAVEDLDVADVGVAEETVERAPEAANRLAERRLVVARAALVALVLGDPAAEICPCPVERVVTGRVLAEG